MMLLMGAILILFLSTLSLRRATRTAREGSDNEGISIHALLAESDTLTDDVSTGGKIFLSTLSLRRATLATWKPHYLCGISIHALLAESDVKIRFLFRLPKKFLSTLSLRRATAQIREVISAELYFYPRSPCGERRNRRSDHLLPTSISIHALLAESDFMFPVVFYLENLFLSTLSLRRATYQIFEDTSGAIFLSTLSLRRATPATSRNDKHNVDFYPRSPCGERPRLAPRSRYNPMDFYPRSPCGERRSPGPNGCTIQPAFLSTLSLRRATLMVLRAVSSSLVIFLSTLSLRRATTFHQRCSII